MGWSPHTTDALHASRGLCQASVLARWSQGLYGAGERMAGGRVLKAASHLSDAYQRGELESQAGPSMYLVPVPTPPSDHLPHSTSGSAPRVGSAVSHCHSLCTCLSPQKLRVALGPTHLDWKSVSPGPVLGPFHPDTHRLWVARSTTCQGTANRAPCRASDPGLCDLNTVCSFSLRHAVYLQHRQK